MTCAAPVFHLNDFKTSDSESGQVSINFAAAKIFVADCFSFNLAVSMLAH